MYRPKSTRQSKRLSTSRRGAVLVLAAFLMVVMLALFAFAVDMGYICLARAQAQVSADSAALAGAQELLCQDRLREYFYGADLSSSNIRRSAGQFAGLHRVGPHDVLLKPAEDVLIGRLENLSDRYSPLDQTNPATYNAVTVTVRATADRDRQLRLFVAPILGTAGVDIETTATAAFADRIAGFRTSQKYPNTSLLPFALKIDDWKDLFDHGRDDWAYDPETKEVSQGADGIREVTMYPLENGPGNWGTVDIGNNNNATPDLIRQIRHGVSAADLAPYGGELVLDSSTQSLKLNGDTGVSAGIKGALKSIIGEPRTIPLYSTAQGSGNTMNYEIVGFAGIRIMEVNLNGGNKGVVIQPAYVVDQTAVAGDPFTQSYFVVQPVRLVR